MGRHPATPPTFEARKALIRLTKSKIWSLIEKVGKSLLRGSVPRVAISCVMRSTIKIELLNTPLLLLNRKKSQDFFRRGEAAKIFGAVALTAAYRFELASTRSPAEGCLFTNASTLFFTLIPGQK